MESRSFRPVVRYLRQLSGSAPAPDAALLERFHHLRDQDAFAVLVERHGPLVLGACRRVLRNEHDAEDVFQATFLVLARKAGAIRERAALASWLYRVAYHLALKLRARLGRAPQPRSATPLLAAPEDALSWREGRAG